MDFYPCLARLGAYIVYFPDKLSLRVSIRRALKQQLRTWLKMPMPVAGVCHFSSAIESLEWYLDSIYKMRLPSSRRDYRVQFDLTVLDPHVKSIAIFVNDLQQYSNVVSAINKPGRLEVCIPAQPHLSELTILLEGKSHQVGEAKAKLANSTWI